MTTVLVGEPPAERQAWLDRRRELGQDGFDEVYHVAPVAHGRQGAAEHEVAFALRAPSRAAGLRGAVRSTSAISTTVGSPMRRTRETALWNPTAAIVVEIISPNDESRLKFGFHFCAGVEKMLPVDPLARTVEWFVRGADAFAAAESSALLDVTATALADEIERPD